jgi:hypothetical protein
LTTVVVGSWTTDLTGQLTVQLLEPKVDEYATEVLGVLFDAVVLSLDFWLIEKPEDPLFQLTAALSGDDFHQADLLFDRFIDDGAKSPIDVASSIVNIVEI